MAQPRISFARRALALQVVVLVVVVGAGLALFGVLLLRELTAQSGEQARAVAHAVAADADVAATVARVGAGGTDAQGVVQDHAERVRRSTDVLFVVVTDAQGIRLSHPNPAEIGKKVSTDPSQALAGREEVTVQHGTLGASARAKVPLRDATGAVIGMVSVGIDTDVIQAHWREILGSAALFSVAALLVGVAGSVVLARQLRRLTLGLEPQELAELVQEREAVLHGIGEGVLAVDAQDRVSVCNGEAERLLGIRPRIGTPVAELPLPPGIRGVLSAAQGEADNLLTLAGDRVLIANRRRVRRPGRDLGSVVTLRDRTDLEALTRELDAVRALTEGLRAQQHEFSNRLHTLAGLLELGHHGEAVDYLHTLSVPSLDGGSGTAVVSDPYLGALLTSKAAVAAEKQVRLELGEDSWLEGRILQPVDVITVVGNLVDNAIEAARLGSVRPAWVDIIVAAAGEELHVSVADSGDGVSVEVAEDLFVSGVSTRAGGSRGLGLALARQAARRLGGEVWVVDAGEGGDRGAVFAARLPHVLAPTVEVAS